MVQDWTNPGLLWRGELSPAAGVDAGSPVLDVTTAAGGALAPEGTDCGLRLPNAWHHCNRHEEK